MLKIHPLASRSRILFASRLIGLAAVWLVAIVSTRGQSPFSPPPLPQTAPTAANTPTTLAPPINTAPSAKVAGPPVSAPTVPSQVASKTAPATPTTSNSAPLGLNAVQPLEGGQIVARIDGQIVLASDVLWQVDRLIEANRDRIPPAKIEEAKRALMRQQVMELIDTKMLYANFRRQVPAENVPQIESNLRAPFEEHEVPRLIKMFNLKSRGELEAMLRDSGTSLADIRRQFNERTIAGEWLRQMMPKPKEATHEEMLDYYKEHQQEYEYPAQAKWEEVMISFNRVDGDRTKAWQTITGIGNEVWQRVTKQPGLRGPVFTEIAKQKSHGFTAKEGGLHDWTTKGALRCQEINDALFTLKVGQLSNPIESERGFHIVRVLDRKEAGRTPFTEAQSSIREALKKGQQKGLAQAELAKIRKKSRVWTVFDGDFSVPQLSREPRATKQR